MSNVIVWDLGAPHVGERTEKQLISAFVDKIAELSPQLVTFNGNSFDPPILRYRALPGKPDDIDGSEVHATSARWSQASRHRNDHH